MMCMLEKTIMSPSQFKEARSELEFTQENLATQMGLTIRHLRRLEQGTSPINIIQSIFIRVLLYEQKINAEN